MSQTFALRRHSSPNASEKVVTAFIVVAPFVAFIASWFLWDSFFVTAAMVQVPIWYYGTVIAITVSFHRELTHRALTLHPVARYTMAAIALFSVEGTIKDWTARHRKHHKYTDREGDPHSPHGFGDGVMGVIKGFFHAHCGWFFREPRPDYTKYIPDLLRDRGLMVIDRFFPVFAIGSFVLPGLITLIFEPSWLGFFAGVFWAGFVRVFLVHHATWSVNSVCHMWGTKDTKSDDHSTNVAVLAPICAGENWHRMHHTFPGSAKIGLKKGQFDLGWIFIRLLAFFRLVRRIRVPTPEQIQAKMIS